MLCVCACVHELACCMFMQILHLHHSAASERISCIMQMEETCLCCGQRMNVSALRVHIEACKGKGKGKPPPPGSSGSTSSNMERCPDCRQTHSSLQEHMRVCRGGSSSQQDHIQTPGSEVLSRVMHQSGCGNLRSYSCREGGGLYCPQSVHVLMRLAARVLQSGTKQV